MCIRWRHSFTLKVMTETEEKLHKILMHWRLDIIYINHCYLLTLNDANVGLLFDSVIVTPMTSMPWPAWAYSHVFDGPLSLSCGAACLKFNFYRITFSHVFV